jgi:ribonuclease P protein component|tara:strand:- start:1110 stop:1490 length:381 start_codon:yes stop_codon:yes gene_type:complete
MNSSSKIGQNTFSKEERITNKKVIDKLFSAGMRISVYPFDVRYVLEKKNLFTKVLVTASKGKIKSSVKRNLLKRRIKESYRLNKSVLHQDLKCNIAFIYSSEKILSYNEINKSLIEVLSKISAKNE